MCSVSVETSDESTLHKHTSQGELESNKREGPRESEEDKSIRRVKRWKSGGCQGEGETPNMSFTCHLSEHTCT